MATKTQAAPAQANGQTHTKPQPESLGELLLNEMLDRASTQLESASNKYCRAIEDAGGQVRKALLTSEAQARIEALLTDDVMKSFMILQNTKLGFMTDRKSGYPMPVVRKCLAEAFIRGVGPFNNEFNIFKNSCMIVQNGWRRKVAELPGMEQAPFISPSDPEEKDWYYKFAAVHAEWVYEGKHVAIDKNVMVKKDDETRTRDDGSTYSLDDSTTIDNLVGKVERKMLEAIYKMYRPTSIGDVANTQDATANDIDQLGALNEWREVSAAADKVGALDWSKLKPLMGSAKSVKDMAPADLRKLSAACKELTKAKTSEPAPADATKCNPATMARLREVIAAENFNDHGLQEACRKLGYAAAYTVGQLDAIAELGAEAVGKIADELASKP